MAAAPQQGSGAAAQAAEEVLQAFRKDLQSARADIMAKNLTLTADEAARFWPAYLKFQAEQTVIVDEQLRAMQKYVDNFETLDDASAMAQVNANLTRDLQINTLRRKWLAEFQKSCRSGRPRE